jgi:hypothetical protein
MRRVCLVIVLSLLVLTLPLTATTKTTTTTAQAFVARNYSQLPLAFEQNQGQAPTSAGFLARGAGYVIALTQDGSAEMLLRSKDGRAQAIHVHLLNAATQKGAGADQLETRVNYLHGNDASKWVTNIPTYEKVRFAGVYPATDLIYYGNQGKLEYDFVVAPGGKPEAIAFRVRGAKVKLLANGDLALATPQGEVVWHKPVVYQESAGKKQLIASRYAIAGDRVSFRVGRYDRARALVIDPAIAYSTFFGGDGQDIGMAIAVNSAGNAYIAGETRSTNLPTSAGAYDSTCGTDGICNNFDGALSDAFVAKLNPTGTALVFATYFGGSDFDDAAGVAFDGSGNVYVAGETLSKDFPGTVIGPARQSDAEFAYVAKLNSTGSALVYAAQFGGADNHNGTGATGVKVDSSGHAFVTGVTEATDFPVTAGAFQTTFGGAPVGTGGDAFVAELNAAGNAFLWASYLGGNMRDSAQDLAIDGSGNVYVTGWTSSQNFPTTTGAYQTTNHSTPPSGFDPTTPFVTKINAGGASLGYSTYLGGSLFDEGHAIAVANGNAYVTGIAQSSNFPTTSGAISRTLHGIADAFVTKLNTTGSGLVYSTYLGGSDAERGGGIAVNSSGVAYVTGVTYSSDFPTNSFAFQQVFGGTEDVFVTQLNTTGTGFAYSSYLGGSDYEEDQNLPKIALNGSNGFVTGATQSSDFPTTPGAFQKTLASPGQFDAFVTRIIPVCALNQTVPSVTICKPATGATVHSPVEIMAGTWDSRKVRLVQVYVDGKKVYEAKLASLDVKLAMSVGTHRVTVQAFDTANTVFKSTVNITVN